MRREISVCVRACMRVRVCVCVFFGGKRSRGQLQLFLIGFYSLSLESMDTHAGTHRVIIALLPFSGYFVTFAPPHNKENGRVKPEERKRGRQRGRGVRQGR